MSQAARSSKGIEPTTFTNAVATVVERILVACRYAQSRIENIQFAISPTLAQPDIIDYSSVNSAKVFTKAREPLKTTFNVKKPNVRLLLSELQVQSENFG
jgi:hypothetical protein